VVDMITAEKNRLSATPPSKRVRTAIGKTIKWLEKQLEEVDSDLDQAVRNSPALVACIRKLLTMLNAMARSKSPWSQELSA